MDANLAAAIALIGALSGALGSVVRSWLLRPRTKAQADQLTAAATVSVSSDNREWAQMFERRADGAERRADQAEHRADEAEHRADQAEHRADQAEQAVDQLEARMIVAWRYVRSLRETMQTGGLTPPPMPFELEGLWHDR
jgi:hypothetical protein